MRDAFAVLFFVSVGMLFDPYKIAEDWPLILATLGIVIGKPLAAIAVVLLSSSSPFSALDRGSARSDRRILVHPGKFGFSLTFFREATNACCIGGINHAKPSALQVHPANCSLARREWVLRWSRRRCQPRKCRRSTRRRTA